MHQRQLQLAKLGINADPAINTEIEGIEKQLQALNDQLQGMLREHDSKPNKNEDDRPYLQLLSGLGDIVGHINDLVGILIEVDKTTEGKVVYLEKRMRIAIGVISVLCVIVLWLLVRSVL